MNLFDPKHQFENRVCVFPFFTALLTRSLAKMYNRNRYYSSVQTPVLLNNSWIIALTAKLRFPRPCKALGENNQHACKHTCVIYLYDFMCCIMVRQKHLNMITARADSWNDLCLSQNSHSTCGRGLKKRKASGALLSCISSVKFFIPKSNHCAFISVWLAATRASRTPGPVRRMYISQPGLRTALPGNKAEMESHSGKTQWTDPTHPSPYHYTTEALRESDSSYAHVCAFLQHVRGVCLTSECVSMHVHA